MFEAHFQSFEDRDERAASAPRVEALRTELAIRGLDGFFVPRADRFQNEYVPPCDERLAWLTGFTGSAGAAIVLKDRAVIFVDGRYVVQVREEVDEALFAVVHLVDEPPTLWIENNLRAETRLGYSPWLHTVEGAERLNKACAVAGAALIAVNDNPIDAIWTERPQPPLGAVVAHDLRFAGEEAKDKLARVVAELHKTAADALVVSDPQAVSWLFNIRGQDVPHTPVVLASAIVPKDGSNPMVQMTDENGILTAKGLKPGDYKLLAWEDVEQGAPYDPDFLRQFEKQMKSLKLDAAAHEALQLIAIPADDR